MSPLDKSLLSPALYKSLRTHWFGPLSPTALIPPQSLLSKWYGFGPAPQKSAFDTSCAALSLPALAALSPTTYPLPSSLPAASSPRTPANWALERHHDATIAGPLLETLTRDGEEGNAATISSKDHGRGEGYARDALALIVLLDQMPRNVFRKEQDKIYAHYDVLARAVVRTLLSSPDRPDRHPGLRLSPAYRAWFYMPLMHSEYIEDHDQYQELIDEWVADVERDFAATAVAEAPEGTAGETEGDQGDEGKETKEAVLEKIESFRGFDKKHSVLVKKYGRYPYRNKWLGREDTDEEREYLENGGVTFGAG